jgi:MFS transporter, DHA1 family, multidrug resistance protein
VEIEGAPGGLPLPPPQLPSKVGIRSILADPPVRIIILVIFVVMLGFGIILPVLPLYARSFGVGYDAASLLISGFAFTRLVIDPVSGPIVDRLGERITAALGLGIVSASSVLTGLAPTFTLAVVFRSLGGAGSAMLFTALTSYLLKVVPKDRMGRTLGLFYGSFNVGVIAGGPIGGLLGEHLGLASPLFFYAGLLVVSVVLFLRFVPDPEAGADPNEATEHGSPAAAPSVVEMLRNRAFITTIYLNFAYLWIIGGVFDTLVPLFGEDKLGLSPGGIGVIFAIVLAAELAVLYPAGSATDRYGRRVVAVPATAALAAGAAMLGLAGSPLAYGLLMIPLGLASGFAGVPPGAMLSDIAPGQRSGTAVGIFRFAGDLGITLGPLAAGLATKHLGFGRAFMLCAIPVAFGAVLAATTPETLASRSRSS